ncbi:MAG: helix-turn-helix domain-containing protein [bacterium]
MEPKMHTTKEVADLIGVHKNTLLNWIRSGKVPEVEKDWKAYRVWTDEDIEKVREFKEKYKQLRLEIG